METDENGFPACSKEHPATLRYEGPEDPHNFNSHRQKKVWVVFDREGKSIPQLQVEEIFEYDPETEGDKLVSRTFKLLPEEVFKGTYSFDYKLNFDQEGELGTEKEALRNLFLRIQEAIEDDKELGRDKKAELIIALGALVSNIETD